MTGWSRQRVKSPANMTFTTTGAVMQNVCGFLYVFLACFRAIGGSFRFQ
jgi:hypothetical protein